MYFVHWILGVFFYFIDNPKLFTRNVTKIICLKFLNCSQKGGGEEIFLVK